MPKPYRVVNVAKNGYVDEEQEFATIGPALSELARRYCKLPETESGRAKLQRWSSMSGCYLDEIRVSILVCSNSEDTRLADFAKAVRELPPARAKAARK